ncbi:MAG TPA: hypothetical protein VGB50_07465 [Flavobacterium sp.]|jgi:hypothetical protein
METNSYGMYGQDSQNSSMNQDFTHPISSSANDETVFPVSDFYDESGKYRSDDFEDLGGLHYMNYLHSHDDML